MVSPDILKMKDEEGPKLSYRWPPGSYHTILGMMDSWTVGGSRCDLVEIDDHTCPQFLKLCFNT